MSQIGRFALPITARTCSEPAYFPATQRRIGSSPEISGWYSIIIAEDAEELLLQPPDDCHSVAPVSQLLRQGSSDQVVLNKELSRSRPPADLIWLIFGGVPPVSAPGSAD